MGLEAKRRMGPSGIDAGASVGKSAENPVDRQHNDHSARVFAGWLVLGGVAGAGVGHGFGVSSDAGRAFERYPIGAVNLADHRASTSSTSFGVDDLLGGVGGNDANNVGVGVVGVPDRHDVGRPVGSQGRERRKATGGHERNSRRGKVTGVHASRLPSGYVQRV